MKAKTLRRIYLREATVMLVAARLAVRFVPAAQLFAWASRPPERIYRFAADEVDRVSWAIEMISSKQWMNTSALPRALAAHAMLRRRGIGSRLCLGVAHERGGLVSHAWIELGHKIILGGAETARFTRLVALGGEQT